MMWKLISLLNIQISCYTKFLSTQLIPYIYIYLVCDSCLNCIVCSGEHTIIYKSIDLPNERSGHVKN